MTDMAELKKLQAHLFDEYEKAKAAGRRERRAWNDWQAIIWAVEEIERLERDKVRQDSQLEGDVIMSFDEFIKIMEDDDADPCINYNDDTAVMGLLLIRKYLPKAGITEAGYNIIYSVDADELSEAGITIADAKLLFTMGWMVQDNQLCHFV